MFPARMMKLVAVVLDSDIDRVSTALLDEGVMQFIRMSPVENEPTEHLQLREPPDGIEPIAQLRARIENLLQPAGLMPEPPGSKDIEDRSPVDLSAETSKVDAIHGQISSVRDQQRIVQQEIAKLEDIQRHIDTYGIEVSQAVSRQRSSFIDVRMGRMPRAQVRDFEEHLQHMPVVAMRAGENEEWTSWLIVAMKRDAAHVDRLLQSVKWAPLDLGDQDGQFRENAVRDLGTKLNELRNRQAQIGQRADAVVRDHRAELAAAWTRLRVNELLRTVQTYFRHSARTAVFSGWLPAQKRLSVEQRLRGATDGRCYMEWFPAVGGPDLKGFDEKPPVQLKNPKALSPFQMLVENFGIPEYGSVDPTPYVTVMYLAMFGLMFADAGHGLVLILLGAAGLWGIKTASRKMRQLFALAVWCGASSILFGILFGAYFGTSLARPLWLDFHGIISGHPEPGVAATSILDILSMTIYFGITVISLGLIFNWINLIRARKWKVLLFEKGGVLGGWIYAGGVYVAWSMVRSGYTALPAAASLMGLVIVPALLMALKQPVYHFSRPGPIEFTPGMAATIVMEWLVELLEIFSGYLSNTLSFMRIAGLGIAHVSLMMVTYEMARTAHDGGAPGVVSLLIVIVGNVFVIALEGLSAGIQALRLNYYEFFTKFFHGTGKLYSPISLRTQ